MRLKPRFFLSGQEYEITPKLSNRLIKMDMSSGIIPFVTLGGPISLISGWLEREIQRGQETIEAAIGKKPAFFRPPMGLTNPHLQGKLKKYGLIAVGWDVRPFDTRRAHDKVIEKVLKKVRNGSIILLHETKRNTADVTYIIDSLMGALKARGFTTVGLEELIGIKAYQIPAAGCGNEPDFLPEPAIAAGEIRLRGGLRRFLARKLASTAYGRRALKERVTLEAFKGRPSPRFLWGVAFVLMSYILGWPMVGLFTVLAAYFHTPSLLIVGPIFYGFSHLVFLFGMYLAGRDCLRYADIMLSWSLRQAVEKALRR